MTLLSADRVRDLIAQGESENVEFKEKISSDSSISIVLSAFANTKGGVLLIGVSNEGQIVGVPDHAVSATVGRLTRILDPMLPLTYDISAIEIDGKHVVYVSIEKVPIYYGPVYTSSGLAYQRQLSSSDAVASTDFYEPDLQVKIRSVEPDKEITAFVAMSFRIEEEPHLEDYFAAMRRAAERTGLPIELVRVDLVEGDYEISQEIMNQIDEADILVADFTLNSRNVYFELGYARGGGKRIVQTARTVTDLQFDVKTWRTTFYRNATELEEKLIPEFRLAYSDIIQK